MQTTLGRTFFGNSDRRGRTGKSQQPELPGIDAVDKVLSSFFVHKNPELLRRFDRAWMATLLKSLLKSTYVFGLLWGQPGHDQSNKNLSSDCSVKPKN